jgi:hypothetical protein
VTRWEHEEILESMQTRLDQKPDSTRIRRQRVEHRYILKDLTCPVGLVAKTNEDMQASAKRCTRRSTIKAAALTIASPLGLANS